MPQRETMQNTTTATATNTATKVTPRLEGDFFSRALNNATNTLKFRYLEEQAESVLKINDFAPIFFSDSAGGTVAGGSINWVKAKHKNKSIHEPATVGAFSFVQKHFSDQIDVVFDVGALYGYFSLISKSMFPKSTVFSFEMNPSSYQALCRNVNANKHLSVPATRCVNVGLSDKTVFQKKVSVHNFMLKEHEDGEAERASDDSTPSVIDILSIDDFCRISGYSPDLIKMDVEGYQAKIFPGAMSTIKARRPIIILEFDAKPQLEKLFDTTNQEITKFLFDLGYRCYWCKEQRGFRGDFQRLTHNSFSEKHETNSLSVFIP